MSFLAGEKNPLYKTIQEHDSVMTLMESTAEEIHDTFEDIVNAQTHYRLVSFFISAFQLYSLFLMHNYFFSDINNAIRFLFSQQEAHGRIFAEELNERVLWWSLMQTFVIFAISVSQVLILRNFFSEPRLDKPLIQPRQPRYGNMQY